MRIAPVLLKTLLISSSLFAVGEYDFTDNVQPSHTPPGGLIADQVPMFITLGVDDLDQSGDGEKDVAIGDMGIRWVINYFEGLQNPQGVGNAATFDGSPSRVSLYLTSVYVAQQGADNPNHIKWILNEAWSKGFEIGLHSQTHGQQILKGSKDYLVNSEMKTCINWLTKPLPPRTQETYIIESSQGCGIPAEDITGWRTPFLAYGNDLLPALKEVGVMYDCSIEEGNHWEQDGTDFRWPYTLDAGSPGHIEGWSGSPDNPKSVQVPNVSGLWELPNHVAMLPPDELCAQYGLDYSLRKKMNAAVTAKAPTQEWFSDETDRFTNFDFNFWSQFGLSGADVTAILKYTLDQRLAGNRAPLMIGAHDGWFHKTKDKSPGINAMYRERQIAYEEFFEYALTKPEVRIVTGHDIIAWCQNPVALNDIHHRIDLTISPDTVAEMSSTPYPAWDETKRYESTADTVHYNDHFWYQTDWNYENIGQEPGVGLFWIDGGIDGNLIVSTPGKVVRDADVVRDGESITYRFVPDAGNKVVELRVNGNWVEPAESYTFSTVADAQSLQVKFGSNGSAVSTVETGIASRVASIRPQALQLSNQKLNLSINSDGLYSIKIFSVNGRELFNREVSLSSGIQSVGLSGLSLSNQMVFVEISTGSFRSVQKIIAQ